MLCPNIWEQHRHRVSAGGCTLRYLRFADYMRLIEQAGLTPELLGRAQYLENKAQLEPLTPEEEQLRAQVLARVPIEGMMASCFSDPQLEGPDHMKAWLYALPDQDRALIRFYLEKLVDTQPTGLHGQAFAGLLGQAGIPLAHDLDFTTITVQQAMVLMASLEQTAKAAKKEG